MFDLDGKTALVTGASGGIGRAIAEGLHAAGATVGLHGTREAVLQEVAAELGERAHVLPANLGDAGAPAELAKAAQVPQRGNLGLAELAVELAKVDAVFAECGHGVLPCWLDVARSLTRAVPPRRNFQQCDCH